MYAEKAIEKGIRGHGSYKTLQVLCTGIIMSRSTVLSYLSSTSANHKGELLQQAPSFDKTVSILYHKMIMAQLFITYISTFVTTMENDAR